MAKWTQRDNFSKRAHQDHLDRTEALENLNTTGELLAEGGPRGRSIADVREELYHLRALAVIVPGETAEYEFDDPRYRCKIQKIILTDEGDESLDDEDDITEQPPEGTAPTESDDPEDGPEVGWTVTARNLAEIEDPETLEGTHILREDGTYVVEIFGRYDLADPPVMRWWFSSSNVPKGQYRGMVLQVVANNAVGYDFTLAHAGLD